jgi:hypothetical protein
MATHFPAARGQEGAEKTYDAFTDVSLGQLYRVWFAPSNRMKWGEKAKAGAFPSDLVPGLDILILHLGSQRLTIPELAKSDILRVVDLSFMDLSDKDIIGLEKCKALRELSLAVNDITDNSIPILEKIPNLEVLNLFETKVTAAGVKRLSSKRPELRINNKSIERVDGLGVDGFGGYGRKDSASTRKPQQNDDGSSKTPANCGVRQSSTRVRGGVQ